MFEQNYYQNLGWVVLVEGELLTWLLESCLSYQEEVGEGEGEGEEARSKMKSPQV